MCTGADTCSKICLLPDFSRVGLSSLPIPAGSKAAAVPAVPGQGGQGEVAALFCLHKHWCFMWVCDSSTHGGKWTWASVLFGWVYLFPFSALPLAENVQWELMILEAGVIRRQMQNIKSMVNLALFFLNQAGNGMMFSRLVLPLYSPDHKFSETGPVPWTVYSPQWGPRMNFGIATAYNLGASLPRLLLSCILGMVLGFNLFSMRVHSLKACPPCLLIYPPQMLLDKVCAVAC